MIRSEPLDEVNHQGKASQTKPSHIGLTTTGADTADMDAKEKLRRDLAGGNPVPHDQVLKALGMRSGTDPHHVLLTFGRESALATLAFEDGTWFLDEGPHSARLTNRCPICRPSYSY